MFGLVGRALFHGGESDEEHEDRGSSDGDERAGVEDIVPVAGSAEAHDEDAEKDEARANDGIGSVLTNLLEVGGRGAVLRFVRCFGARFHTQLPLGASLA
jgi:hypothetical protein